jgi:predicted MFS family arabinose efflux permease
MSRPIRGSASYRAVLTLPHARGLFATAMLARLSYGLLPLPLLLSLKQGTGSYAVAGTATGLFGLFSALLGPMRARLVERRPRALMVLAACYAALLATIATASTVGLAPWLAMALALAVGVFPPPVGPLMRTLWGSLAAHEAQRQSALSLDTVSESTVFALGPFIAGVLITAGSAPLALAACAGLAVVGFSAFAAALRRVPGRLRSAADAISAPRSAWGPLRIPGFAALLLVVFGCGCALAVEEIAAVCAWGAGVTGSLLALCSVGGVLGGLVYGRRTWRASPGRRLVALGVAGAACYALPALVTAVPSAAVALVCAGACGDALLITSYLLVDALAAQGSRTEAGAWVNTAYNLGVALGSGFAGLIVDRRGPGAVFAAAAAVAGVGALAAVARERRAVHSSPAGASSRAHGGDLAEAEILERHDD